MRKERTHTYLLGRVPLIHQHSMINSLFMKKGMLFTLAMAAGMSLWAQEKPKQVILPGKGKLDI